MAVEVDVVNQGLEALVVQLLADKAKNEQSHGDVVKVAGELVQDVDLCAADGVFVKWVVTDRHDHGEDGEGLRGGGRDGCVGRRGRDGGRDG